MWITPTLTDLKRKFTTQVLTVVENYTAQTGSTSDDLLTQELAAAINEVRGYVSAFEVNVLGESGTIPDELTNPALVLARRNVYNNVPALNALFNAGMQKELETVTTQLRDVAKGAFRVVPPTVAADLQPSGAGFATVTPATNANNVEKLSGLL